MNVTNVGVLLLAVLVVIFIGAYALLYPGSSNGTLALGALLTLAGLIGGYFFHAGSNAFLGAQLSAQRGLTAQALTVKQNGSGGSSTPSTTSSASLPGNGTTVATSPNA